MKREGSRGGHFDDTATVAIVSATVGCLVLIVASLAFYYLVSRNGSFSRTGTLISDDNSIDTTCF